MTALLRLLRAQRTGIICAGLACLLMGAGSVWMDIAPERYEGLHVDDLRFFVEPPDVAHIWIYGLAVVLAVWALSAAICTFDALVARIRRGVLRPSAYGAPLLHISFVGALLAHLWGGFTGVQTMHRVGEAGTVVHGARYELVDIRHEAWPSGMPKFMQVMLRRGVAGATDGATEELELGYNDPIVLHGGATVLLLARVGQGFRGTFELGGERVVLGPRQAAVVGGKRLVVKDIIYRRGLRVPVAHIAVGEPGASRPAMVGLGVGAAEGVAFVDAAAERVVDIKERHNPSFPLTLLLSGFVAIGAVLAGWERLSRR